MVTIAIDLIQQLYTILIIGTFLLKRFFFLWNDKEKKKKVATPLSLNESAQVFIGDEHYTNKYFSFILFNIWPWYIQNIQIYIWSISCH